MKTPTLTLTLALATFLSAVPVCAQTTQTGTPPSFPVGCGASTAPQFVYNFATATTTVADLSGNGYTITLPTGVSQPTATGYSVYLPGAAGAAGNIPIPTAAVTGVKSVQIWFRHQIPSDISPATPFTYLLGDSSSTQSLGFLTVRWGAISGLYTSSAQPNGEAINKLVGPVSVAYVMTGSNAVTLQYINGAAAAGYSTGLTGSPATGNTIGTVRVACSNGPTVEEPWARMTSGASAANSAACLRMSAALVVAQRVSMRTL